MRRSRLLAIIAPAVALIVSACSFGSSPGSATVATPAADATASATPASALATAATGPKPAALPGSQRRAPR